MSMWASYLIWAEAIEEEESAEELIRATDPMLIIERLTRPQAEEEL